MGSASASQERNSRFMRGLGRAVAGAIIFGLPLLMTMEMWRLGMTMPAWKLALLLVGNAVSLRSTTSSPRRSSPLHDPRASRLELSAESYQVP